METSAPPELRTRRLPYRLLLYGFVLVFAVAGAIAYVDALATPLALAIAFAVLAIACFVIAQFARDATLIKWASWLTRFAR